jgi:diacylglycerol kinase family enzyme
LTRPEGPIAVILNPASGSGTAATADGITELFAAGGDAVAITRLGDGVSVPDVVHQAIKAGAPAVVAAGGDGTVSAVAAALIGSDVPLGVLPVGTLNHFAKDLGLPLKLEEAVEIVQGRNVRVVDAGEVNGRIFLNNSSIGVYPRLVELRDRYRESGITKWIAAAWAGLAVLRLRPFMGVRIESPEGVLLRRTPFVLVGNNEYQMSGLHATSRESLTGGKLAVYVMKAQGRPSLLRLAWQVLRRGVSETPELDFLSVAETTVETRRRNLQVALDGEVVTLQSPLRYKILPGVLRVLAP